MTKKEYLEKQLELIPIAANGYRAIDQMVENSMSYFIDDDEALNQILDAYNPDQTKKILQKLIENYEHNRKLLNDIIVEECHKH